MIGDAKDLSLECAVDLAIGCRLSPGHYPNAASVQLPRDTPRAG